MLVRVKTAVSVERMMWSALVTCSAWVGAARDAQTFKLLVTAKSVDC